jgi:hypothetical protein
MQYVNKILLFIVIIVIHANSFFICLLLLFFFKKQYFYSPPDSAKIQEQTSLIWQLFRITKYIKILTNSNNGRS